MIKKFFMFFIVVFAVLFISGCNKQKIKNVEIYNFQDLINETTTDGIEINHIPLMLNDERNYYNIHKYKGAIVTSSFNKATNQHFLSYYNKEGTLLWENSFSNLNSDLSKVYYFKDGIVISFIEEYNYQTVKFNRKGKEEWHLNGELDTVYDDAGFFAILKDKLKSYALYLDANGEVVYKHGPYDEVDRVWYYDDQSILYYYKNNKEPFYYVKVKPNGTIPFTIKDEHNKAILVDEALYVSNSFNLRGDLGKTINKYEDKKVYQLNGNYTIDHIFNHNLYTIQHNDSSVHFVKYDYSGKEVFKTGPYNWIEEIDYLSDGSFYLYTVDHEKQEVTVIKLDANGIVLTTAGPYQFDGRLLHSVKFLKKASEESDNIILVTSGVTNGEMTNANVVTLGQNLTEVMNETYDWVKIVNQIIFYKKGNQFGVLVMDEKGTLVDNELEEVSEFNASIKNVSNLSLQSSTVVMHYHLENSESSILKLIQINPDGAIFWEMETNLIPNDYYEYQTGKKAFIFEEGDQKILRLYDQTLNLLQEIRFVNGTSFRIDEDKLIVVTRDEQAALYVKVFDEQLNLITEGKLITSESLIKNRVSYFIKDATNQVIEINIKLM